MELIRWCSKKRSIHSALQSWADVKTGELAFSNVLKALVTFFIGLPWQKLGQKQEKDRNVALVPYNPEDAGETVKSPLLTRGLK